MCHLFPSTLTGAALNQFYRLNPRTINSFDRLKQIFLDHFMIQTDRLYSRDDLYMIRQGEDEPLREYAAHFSHEYSRYLKTDDCVAFGVFKSGLRESNFWYLVHSSSQNTYAELMMQVTIHAKDEYFNSKNSFVGQSQITFGDSPQASAYADPLYPHPRVTTHSKPTHYIPTNDTQGGQHFKRKYGYQRPFNNGK